MVSKIVTENIEALKNAPQTFESIYTIIKNRFTSELFGEWLENGEICKMSYYELYERVDLFSKAAVAYADKQDSDSKFVGIFLENSCDWVALFWGLLQAGFKPILLNTRHNININNDIIKEMDPVFDQKLPPDQFCAATPYGHIIHICCLTDLCPVFCILKNCPSERSCRSITFSAL